jgi:methylmalonyl-CoA mutase
MSKAIETGMPKQRILESATRRQTRIDAGLEAIVGVNKYISADDPEIDVRSIDNSVVQASQIERLLKVKSGRDESLVQEKIEKIKEAARTDD